MHASTVPAELLLKVARSSSAEDVRALVVALLDAAGLDRDQRVELLGGALVTEAVRPYWAEGMTAAEAHAELQVDDPELSEAVEALSPMLLGRAHAREESRQAIHALETLLRG